MLKNAKSIDVIIELETSPSTIKTRYRDDKEESMRVIKSFSGILRKKGNIALRDGWNGN